MDGPVECVGCSDVATQLVQASSRGVGLIQAVEVSIHLH